MAVFIGVHGVWPYHRSGVALGPLAWLVVFRVRVVASWGPGGAWEPVLGSLVEDEVGE